MTWFLMIIGIITILAIGLLFISSAMAATKIGSRDSSYYFEQKEVDVIVMEVGIGGLLDATNILNYDLSLITSIGFDHMKQLGNTLESIASNKLGILKPENHLIVFASDLNHA